MNEISLHSIFPIIEDNQFKLVMSEQLLEGILIFDISGLQEYERDRTNLSCRFLKLRFLFNLLCSANPCDHAKMHQKTGHAHVGVQCYCSC